MVRGSGPSCKRKPCDSLQIFVQPNFREARRAEKSDHRLALIVADFHRHPAAGIENGADFADEAPNQIESVLTGKKGGGWVMGKFRGEVCPVGFGDIRKVRDNQIEFSVDGMKQVAVNKFGGEAQTFGIFRRKTERFR